MWKFQNLPATQILREINFGNFEARRIVTLTILETLNLDFWDFFDIFKLEVPKNQNSKPQKLLKWQFFTF